MVVGILLFKFWVVITESIVLLIWEELFVVDSGSWTIEIVKDSCFKVSFMLVEYSILEIFDIVSILWDVFSSFNIEVDSFISNFEDDSTCSILVVFSCSELYVDSFCWIVEINCSGLVIKDDSKVVISSILVVFILLIDFYDINKSWYNRFFIFRNRSFKKFCCFYYFICSIFVF